MIKEIVEENLDGKEIVIVDFENFQGVPTDLLDENGVYYLFCGKTTTKKANEYRKMLEDYNVFIKIWQRKPLPTLVGWGMNLPQGNFVYIYSKKQVYDIIVLQNI